MSIGVLKMAVTQGSQKWLLIGILKEDSHPRFWKKALPGDSKNGSHSIYFCLTVDFKYKVT